MQLPVEWKNENVANEIFSEFSMFVHFNIGFDLRWGLFFYFSFHEKYSFLTLESNPFEFKIDFPVIRYEKKNHPKLQLLHKLFWRRIISVHPNSNCFRTFRYFFSEWTKTPYIMYVCEEIPIIYKKKFVAWIFLFFNCCSNQCWKIAIILGKK